MQGILLVANAIAPYDYTLTLQETDHAEIDTIMVIFEVLYDPKTSQIVYTSNKSPSNVMT